MGKGSGVEDLSFWRLLTGFGYNGFQKLSPTGITTLKKMIKDQEKGDAVVDFVKASANNQLSDYDYWALLGILYIHGGYTNFMTPQHWRLLFANWREGRNYVMQPFEIKRLRNLDDQVTCYRIHHSKDEDDWISYTINPNLLKVFKKSYEQINAFYNIEKFIVNKRDIDFYFGRNHEDEIVVLDRSKLISLEKKSELMV